MHVYRKDWSQFIISKNYLYRLDIIEAKTQKSVGNDDNYQRTMLLTYLVCYSF